MDDLLGLYYSLSLASSIQPSESINYRRTEDNTPPKTLSTNTVYAIIYSECGEYQFGKVFCSESDLKKCAEELYRGLFSKFSDLKVHNTPNKATLTSESNPDWHAEITLKY